MDTGMITEEVYWQALDKSQWVNDYDALYALRRVCCTTMLRHIAAHPDDWMAINNFLVCGYLDNILRYGDYPYGNQSMMERLEVFSTYYDRIMGRTHEE